MNSVHELYVLKLISPANVLNKPPRLLRSD